MAFSTKALESLRIDRGDPSSRYTGSGPPRWLKIGLPIAIALLAAGYFLLRDTRPVVTAVSVEAVGGASGAGAVLNGSGYVVARRIATVSSKVTGRIAEVLIEEGAAVKKGQLLARLDAATESAQAQLARRQLEAASGALAEAQVRLAEAERNLGRTKTLRERALVSEGALDTAQAEVDSLKARLQNVRAQQRVAASSVTLRERDLADLEIRAPFDGVVISKDAQPGEMISPVSAGGGFTRTGIATIVDMESREIEVDVNEAFINRVRTGQKVEATLDAYSDWAIPARVINIVPTADRTKATVRVRIGFEQLDERILPDMGIKVRFLEDGNAQVAARARVDASAVTGEGEARYVFRIDNGRAERRAVRVGVERDGKVDVEAGLQAGDRVIAPVPEGLTDGTRVRIAESAG